MGSSFAVVAGDVRKLAERTSVSATEINQRMKDIQMQTGSAVQNMAQMMAQADHSVSKTQSAGDNMQHIHEGTEKMMAAIEHPSASRC